MFNRANRSFIVAAFLLVMFGVTIGRHAHAAAAADGIAAKVNGAAIYDRDLQGELKGALQELLAGGVTPTEEQLAQFRTETLERLIKIELLFQKSEKAGVKVDPQMMDSQIQTLKARFPSEDQYKEFLTGLGLTEDEVKKQFRKNFSVQQFIKEQFADKTKITDMEIREYFDSNQDKFVQPDSVKASHILILVKEGESKEEKDKKRAKLQQVRKEILEGADFADMAKRFSECPSNAKGGDLGYFTRGQMVAPFETAAFAMMPGDMSDIVETKFGFHLIKLVDKKAEKKVSYDEAKEQIAGYLTQVKVGQEIERFVDGLRKEADVKIF